SCAAINQPAHILSVSPRAAYPGTTVQVIIRGEFGNFRAGITKASFGAGVSVGPVTVIDTDTATVQLTIAAGQSGDRDVTVTTGSITAARAGGFSLSAGNRPPVVQVSADQRVILPATVGLSGTVTDDGLPTATV